MTTRLTGITFDDVSDRIWSQHPEALAVVIRYLYCGWWECEVIR